ncbi:MAG: PilZ domain-containing protein [Nitrospiraceae bacterium]|nr:PilZ domain-containing protein [Nitrospiraceae bacterium]
MIELRQQRRIPVNMQVIFAHAGATSLKQGTLFDLSTGGCAVATTVAVPPGVPLSLLIEGQDLGTPIRIPTATVRWTKLGEFGVEFLALPELERRRLYRLIDYLRPSTT